MPVSYPDTPQYVPGHAFLYCAPDLRFSFDIPPRSDMELTDRPGCAVHCDGLVDGVLRRSYLLGHWFQN